MKFLAISAVAVFFVSTFAHPEKLTKATAKHHITTRGTTACAAQIEARREKTLRRRQESLAWRSSKSFSKRNPGLMLKERNMYPTIQNTTCVLAPETVWGPYAIDGELHRHDVRENQPGVDLYLDIGVIDVETCEPLPDAWLTIWACNATGTYSGFTGIDPDTASLQEGWSTRTDGTTDEDTFLRGISKTDPDGMSEFLTIFPGYYTSRTTHIHITVQTNVSGKATSYSDAAVQHLGQLFFAEDLINEVYQRQPYYQHLSTLNRTTNAEDSLYSTANGDGYSAMISTSLLGTTIADGLAGYITIGVNRTATPATTTGGSVNVLGKIPTVTPSAGARKAAYDLDYAEGYLD